MKWYIYLSLLLILFNSVKCQYKSFAEAKFDLPDNLPAEDPLFQLQKDENYQVVQKPDIKIENINLGKPIQLTNNIPQVNLPQVNLPQVNFPQVNLPQINVPQFQQPTVNSLGFQQITNTLESRPPTGALYLPEMLQLPSISEVNGVPQTPPLPFEEGGQQQQQQEEQQHLPTLKRVIPTAHPPKISFNTDDDKKEKVFIAHAMPTFKSPKIENHNSRFDGVPRIVKPSKFYKNPRNEKSLIPSTPFYDVPLSAVEKKDSDTKSNEGENYFIDTYNITDCPRDSRYTADLFYQKFPKNVLAPGKDIELVNLLGPRLEQCYLKREKKHWYKVETFIGRIGVSKEDEESCKIGLIQEQIACMNLISYSCQFVQHDYQFKLIAARVVLGEARQAEGGENKCREVVKAIKSLLIKSG